MTFLPMSEYQVEALLICLAASLIWAPIVLGVATLLARKDSSNERLWIGALVIAILPTLAAPVLASLGISLRAAPEPIEFTPSMVEVAFTLPPVIEGAAPEPARMRAPTIEQMVGATGILYVYGTFLMVMIWLGKASGCLFASGSARAFENKKILAEIENWRDRLEIDHQAEVKTSPHFSSVCLTGFLRPVIMIPADMPSKFDDDAITAMCAHELAHLKRHDRRLFSATGLARALFWFNPFVKTLTSKVEYAAEEEADRLVIEGGVDRRAYATYFVDGIRFAAAKATHHQRMALAFTPNERNSRKRRLDSILNPSSSAPAPFHHRAMLLGAASIAGLTAVAQAAAAVDPESESLLDQLSLSSPLDGDVTFGFGERANKADENGKAHQGIDIKAKKGTPVVAPRDGKVVAVKRQYTEGKGYGKLLVLDHGKGLMTRYAHLDTIKVEPGDKVLQGDIVATVGSTGHSTGPHLHFEALINGRHVDPEGLLQSSLSVALGSAPRSQQGLNWNDKNSPSRGLPTDKDAGHYRSKASEQELKTAAKPEAKASPAPKREDNDWNIDTDWTTKQDQNGAEAAPRFAFNGDLSDLAKALEFSGTFEGLDSVGTLTANVDWSDLSDIDLSELSVSGEAILRSPDGKELIAKGAIDALEGTLLGGKASSNKDQKMKLSLSFNDGSKTYRYSSDDPVSADDRRTVEAAIARMREDLAETRRERQRTLDDQQREAAERSRARSAKEREKAWKRHMKNAENQARIAQQKAMKQAERAQKQAMAQIQRQQEQIKLHQQKIEQQHLKHQNNNPWEHEREAREFQREAEREMREHQREIEREMREHQREVEREASEHLRDLLHSLEDARRDLIDQKRDIEGACRDALDDVKDAKRDIYDEEMSSKARAKALEQLEDMAKELEKKKKLQIATIESSIDDLKDQQTEIKRQLKGKS